MNLCSIIWSEKKSFLTYRLSHFDIDLLQNGLGELTCGQLAEFRWHAERITAAATNRENERVCCLHE